MVTSTYEQRAQTVYGAYLCLDMSGNASVGPESNVVSELRFVLGRCKPRQCAMTSKVASKQHYLRGDDCLELD